MGDRPAAFAAINWERAQVYANPQLWQLGDGIYGVQTVFQVSCVESKRCNNKSYRIAPFWRTDYLLITASSQTEDPYWRNAGGCGYDGGWARSVVVSTIRLTADMFEFDSEENLPPPDVPGGVDDQDVLEYISDESDYGRPDEIHYGGPDEVNADPEDIADKEISSLMVSEIWQIAWRTSPVQQVHNATKRPHSSKLVDGSPRSRKLVGSS